jgi:hypothetical protein
MGSPTTQVADASTIQVSKYPNPGYLGSSSHTTFFDHLPIDSSRDIVPNKSSVDAENVDISAKFLERFYQSIPVSSSIDLVRAWLTTGTNLALAGLFTEHCTQSMQYLYDEYFNSHRDAAQLSRRLFVQSCHALAVDSTTTMESFCRNFCQQNARWETLGLFFAAATRSTLELPIFSPLYDSEQQRRRYQRIFMQYSDRCLDLALSLDNLNDLLLMLQYENWICHSFIDGDQSE